MLVLGYLALAVLGAGYVLISMLLGHVSDFGSHDAGGDAGADAGGDAGAHAGGDAHAAGGEYGVDQAGHGEVMTGHGVAPAFHFPFFSPLALSTLAASIGGLGLVARFGMRLADGPSLLVAVPGALVLTYVVTFVAWRLASGSRGTSTIRAAHLEGAAAEILTPIPAGGVGEAAASVGGQGRASVGIDPHRQDRCAVSAAGGRRA
jgi:hypothetical protein